MIRILSRAALAAATLSLLAAPLHAHDSHAGDHAAHDAAHTADVVHAGDLEISGAFTRATLPGQPAGGGYVTITNTGDADDTLLGGSADFAGHVEVHEMAVIDDVMNMRELPDGLTIAAGETVTLQPGGLHLMFMQMQAPLVEGEPVTVTLEFAQAGTVEVTFAVAAMGARDMPGHDHGHDHGEDHDH